MQRKINNNGALIVNQTVCLRCLLLDDDVLGLGMAGRWWSFRADVFGPLLTEMAPANHRLCCACGQPQLVRSGSTDQWLGCGLLAEPSDGCQKNLFKRRSAKKEKRKKSNCRAVILGLLLWLSCIQSSEWKVLALDAGILMQKRVSLFKDFGGLCVLFHSNRGLTPSFHLPFV